MKYLFLLTLFVVPNLKAASTKILFWHSMSGEKGKLLGELIESFNQSELYRGKYEVVLQFIGGYEEGLNKVRTSLLAKRGPNIAQITDIGTQVMIDTRAIAPLHDFIEKDPEFPLQQILGPIRRYYEINGKLFSLPFATSTPILYYNAEAYDKAGLTRAPETFSELQQWAKKLTLSSEKSFGITWPLNGWFFEQFIARQGQLLVNNDNGRKARATEALYLTPEAKRFVQLWYDMVKEGSFSNVGRGWDPALANFLAGRAKMLITTTADVFQVLKKASFKVNTAPIPKADGNSGGGTIVGGNSLWIFQGKPSDEMQGSYLVLKFLASKEIQKRWHMGTGYFPIREDLIQELEKEGFYQKFPAAKTAIVQLKSAQVMTATQGALMGVFAEARDQIESSVERVLADRMSIDEALKRAKFQTDDALRRYNRFLEKLK